MMRKLAIILRSAQVGGVENHAYEILKAARPNGFEPTLVSLVDVGFDRKFTDLNIKLIKLNDRMEMSFRSIPNILYLIKTLKNWGPHLVHLHGARPIFVGSIAAKLAGKLPVVATLHGSYKLMAYDKEKKLRAGLLLASKLIHTTGFLLADRIILDAEALRREVEEVIKFLPVKKPSLWEKVHIIYPGIDPKQIRPSGKKTAIKRKIGLSNEKLVIGTIGRLDEPMKGVGILLRACAELLKSGHDFNVLIVGDGYSKDLLIQQAKNLGIGDKVMFTGFWENLAEIFSILDIFVLPSLSEGFPLVNLEAMAYGLPVISTRVGGTAEAILDRNSGLIVPPANVKSLAQAILFFIQKETERQRFGERAKQIFYQKFTKEKMLEKIFKLYNDCLKDYPKLCSSSSPMV